MRDDVISEVTKTKGRKSLYHFTRARNLPAIAHLDRLLSSYNIDPHLTGERRAGMMDVSYDELTITINAHLRIPDSMIDPSTTQEQFRSCLDRHVFFWPTVRDCLKMLDMYTRREPDEQFAILEADAYCLLSENDSAVKFSKYDSGSAPRFPHRCSYKKSLGMFLPANEFKRIINHTVPTKASEIREVLIEDQVNDLTKYLRAIYLSEADALPIRWRGLAKPLADLQNKKAK
ncbi:hypothetical protein [Bacillus sp. FJAT-26390]|uniref:DUF7002 family protein n=1 Tax=Bacillus sp. FJAT-26390 TaxID=1743142 RepID=UPI0008080B47|nr:hypothetical protein [Bacillus sp. FJAT-26390]OBZ17472.1 hypothetical protein A7975_06295 [Bacillus sp. FJAT-26390]